MRTAAAMNCDNSDHWRWSIATELAAGRTEPEVWAAIEQRVRSNRIID